MEPSVDAVFEAAMMLTEEERFALVARLLKSLPPEDSAISINDLSLRKELDRRFADREGAVPWSQLKSEG